MLRGSSVCVCRYFIAFSWQSNTLLYTYTTFGLSTLRGHLGYFHLLTVVTCAAFEHLYKVFGWRYFISLGYIPSRGIAGSHGLLTFNFLRNCQTDFQTAEPFYTPTSNVQCVPFLHMSSNTVIVFFFFLPHFSRCEVVVSHCDFHLLNE